MKKILTLSLLLAGLNCFAQKVTPGLHLKLGSTYYLNSNAGMTITEAIKGQNIVISTTVGAKAANKVIAVTDTAYQMEVRYVNMKMHMETGGRTMDFNSDDKDTANIGSKIFSGMINQPFYITISKSGKVLDVKNTAVLYAHLFDHFPNLSDAQKAQFKAQMEQAFGDKAIKNNFQDGFPEFPGKPVGINDSWTAQTKLESAVTANINTTYTLQSITDSTLVITGKAAITPGADNGFKTLMNVQTHFTNTNGSTASTFTLDRNTGWIKEGKMSREVKSTVEIKDSPQTPGGLTFPMTVTADVTVTDK